MGYYRNWVKFDPSRFSKEFSLVLVCFFLFDRSLREKWPLGGLASINEGDSVLFYCKSMHIGLFVCCYFPGSVFFQLNCCNFELYEVS